MTIFELRDALDTANLLGDDAEAVRLEECIRACEEEQRDLEEKLAPSTWWS